MISQCCECGRFFKRDKIEMCLRCHQTRCMDPTVATERRLAQGRARYHANREARLETQRQWRELNRDRLVAEQRARRARAREKAPPEPQETRR